MFHVRIGTSSSEIYRTFFIRNENHHLLIKQNNLIRQHYKTRVGFFSANHGTNSLLSTVSWHLRRLEFEIKFWFHLWNCIEKKRDNYEPIMEALYLYEIYFNRRSMSIPLSLKKVNIMLIPSLNK